MYNSYAASIKSALKRRPLFRIGMLGGGNARLYVTKGGTPWVTETPGGEPTHYIMNDPKRRWSSQRWRRYLILEQIRKARQIDPEAAERSRGAAKRAWYQVAKEIGPAALARCKAPDFVTQASNTFYGKPEKKVAVIRREGSDGAYMLTMVVSSKLLGGGIRRKGLDGKRILESAMKIRVAAFRHAAKQGYFDSLTKAAKRYPGVFVT